MMKIKNIKGKKLDLKIFQIFSIWIFSAIFGGGVQVCISLSGINLKIIAYVSDYSKKSRINSRKNFFFSRYILLKFSITYEFFFCHGGSIPLPPCVGSPPPKPAHLGLFPQGLVVLRNWLAFLNQLLTFIRNAEE